MSVTPDLTTRRWKRVEYERLVECGVFKSGERLELLGGLLVVREPQTSAHATAIRLVDEALRAMFGHGWDVRCQLPVALDDDSEPEPDVSVVPGSPRDYATEHPSRPVLIVEVALDSLTVDRRYKSSLYARARVPDYWIVNLVDRALEVRRQPVVASDAPHGSTYAALAVLGPDDAVAPLAAPGSRLWVRDILPPR